VDLAAVQPVILGHFDLWLKPEFRLTVGTMDVHVKTQLFAREEKEPETILTEDSGAHHAPESLSA
jgi:hypothetical protein